MSGRFSVGVNVCLDFDFKILCTLYIPRHKFPAWCHRWRLAAFNRVSDIWPVVRYTRCGHNTSSMKQFWCTCKIIGVKRIREIQSLYGRRWRLTLVTSVTRWRHDAMTLTLSRILTSATYNRPTLLRSLPFALRPVRKPTTGRLSSEMAGLQGQRTRQLPFLKLPRQGNTFAVQTDNWHRHALVNSLNVGRRHLRHLIGGDCIGLLTNVELECGRVPTPTNSTA